MPLLLVSLLSDATRQACSVAKRFSRFSHDPPPKPLASSERVKRDASDKPPELYADWLASRRCSENDNEHLPPGAHRRFSFDNLKIACRLARCCTPEVLSCLWDAHPYRISLMVTLDLARGVFPAFRGYSQALMIDEVCIKSVSRAM